jgi:hypothetical protein
MAAIVAGIALFFSHPVLAIALGVLWFFPWRWFFDALAVGLGLRVSGFASRRPRYPRRSRWSRAELDRYDIEGRRAPPRLRGRRENEYQPFDDPIDMG